MRRGVGILLAGPPRGRQQARDLLAPDALSDPRGCVVVPCISATDDRMHLADMGRSPSQDAAVDRTTSHNLLLSLQLEDPEHGQTTQPFLLTFTACFYLIARLEARKIVRQFSYSSLGRAPPALTVA